jgi:zinc protease
MTKRVLVAMLFALAALSPAFAQDKTPTADQILDKYYQAIGGKAAVEKLNSRVTKGSFELPAMGMTGSIEGYAKAPNKNITIITLEGFGEVKQGFTGTEAWSLDPMNGMKVMSGDELDAAKRESDFYNTVKIKENFAKLEVKGTEKVGDKTAYVVVATPAKGAPEKFYFDTQSGLLLRHDTERKTEQGLLHIEATLEDYKDVDGVKMPFTVKQSNEAMTFVIKFSEIKHNVPVDDAKFNKPSN